VRYLAILFLIFIAASLGSSLFFLYKDRGEGNTRMVKALTIRVGLSILLFVLLMLGYRFGLITGHI
jgi:Protein of unknown function (DUF2909)